MLLTEITSNDEVTKFINTVVRDCRPYLMAKEPEQFLYRGMNSDEFAAYNKPIRKNRIPKDMPEIIHETIDSYFKKHFGVYFRSNAIFTISDYNFADAYGTVYAVYPVGRFQFLWSPNVKDLFTKLAGILSKNYDVDIDMFKSEDLNKDDIARYRTALNDIPNILENLKYKNTDLDNAIDAQTEVMLSGSTYHALSVRHNEKESLIDIENKIYEQL